MAKKKTEENTQDKIESEQYDFISSGCQLLDCCIGGGFPLGRVSNIIGDKSTNKTGLSIELMANFRKKYPKGFIWYQDAEAAFDIEYALRLGLPQDERLIPMRFSNIEATYDTMVEATEIVKREKEAGLYIVDSYDALMPTPEEGKEKKLDGGFNGSLRAKSLNSLITKITPMIEETNIHLQVVSQIRDNVGAKYGDKWRRSGGRALDFYASQIIFLSKVSPIYRTIKGSKRDYGIVVKAKVKKNKIGLPFRECEFPVIFNLGIDDTLANLEFLASIKDGLEPLGIAKSNIDEESQRINTENDIELKQLIAKYTIQTWNEIEKAFEPTWKKY